MTQQLNYTSFGFVYSSVIELPGVPIAQPDQLPSVRIRWGELPEHLSGAADAGSFHGITYEARSGEILIAVAGVARYLISFGTDIVIDADRTSSLDEVRACLMGSAFGALLQQRSMLLLHASAVQVGDGCVAFAGAAGAGKSTLATICREAGYDVVGDDLCPLALDADGNIAVWPGFPRIKVWSDSLAALGVDCQELPRVIRKCDKFELPAYPPSVSSVPLRRLYILSAASSGSDPPAGITPVAEVQRLEALVNNTYRYEFLKGMGLREQHFHMCTALLRQVAIFRLTREWDLQRARDVMAYLHEDFRTLAAQAGEP